MKDKFADVDSVVGYVSLDDNEYTQIKLVNDPIPSREDELSIHSAVGKALKLACEGEIRTVEIDEDFSYKIKVITIINPVKKPEQLTLNPFGTPIVLNDFISAANANYASYISKIESGLIPGHAYGTTAKEIYLKGVEHFDWSASKVGSFCPQKLLFSKDCSPEGYSVWFLTYSNINNDSNPKANWSDYINTDFNVIKEFWKKTDDRFHDDNDIRITFARQKDGKYVYLGIFQVKEFDEENKCKTYHLIEENYHC